MPLCIDYSLKFASVFLKTENFHLLYYITMRASPSALSPTCVLALMRVNIRWPTPRAGKWSPRSLMGPMGSTVCCSMPRFRAWALPSIMSRRASKVHPAARGPGQDFRPCGVQGLWVIPYRYLWTIWRDRTQWQQFSDIIWGEGRSPDLSDGGRPSL